MTAMPKSPNILFITSDQQRADCFGFAGRRVKTPHLDAMARAGTRFEAAITPNLVCQPSRASILTGLLPLTHGGDGEKRIALPFFAENNLENLVNAH